MLKYILGLSGTLVRYLIRPHIDVRIYFFHIYVASETD